MDGYGDLWLMMPARKYKPECLFPPQPSYHFINAGYFDIYTGLYESSLHGQVPGIGAINAFLRSGFFNLDLFSGAHLCTQ